MISLGCNAFRVLSDEQIGAHFKYFLVKNHVQTVCECHDLNMDFRSLDYDFKQLNIQENIAFPGTQSLIFLVAFFLS